MARPRSSRTGRRLGGAFRLLAALDGVHHEVKEPHYYLSLLGTDPLYQRSGAGSAAIQPVLDACDAQGLTAYLETQKEANLAYYRATPSSSCARRKSRESRRCGR